VRVPSSKAEKLTTSVGFAEAFLRGGVANYVGTYWPVGDAAAKSFATKFYTEVLKPGTTIGAALRAARAEVRGIKGTIDWADYIHYGNQSFVLKEGK
jgi:CHAT domain-containing protein